MVNVIWHNGYRDTSGDLPRPPVGTIEVTADRDIYESSGERLTIWANKQDSETALSLSASLNECLHTFIFWSKEERDTSAYVY